MRTVLKLALSCAALATGALAALPADAAPAGHGVVHGGFGPRFGGRFGGPHFGGPRFYGWYGSPYWYGFYSPFWGYPYYAYPGAYDYPPTDNTYGPDAGPGPGYGPQAQPQAGPAPNQSWYYCSNPQGYYPYVQSCTTQWQPVSPTPPQQGAQQPLYPQQAQPQGPAPLRLQP